MKTKRLAFVFALLILALSSCETIRLERALSRDIREWYDIHYVLMDTKVPKWIDEWNRSERGHFLRLPQEYQKKYIELFWEMRQDGAEEEFNYRLDTIKRFIKEGFAPWLTDRGRLLLLCGVPNEIYFITVNDIVGSGLIGRSLLPTEDMNIQNQIYQVWQYVFHNNQIITYIFAFQAPDSWHTAIGELASPGSDQRMLENYWKEQFAPTEDGWSLWAGTLYNLIREKK